jgi:hypothetical protein
MRGNYESWIWRDRNRNCTAYFKVISMNLLWGIRKITQLPMNPQPKTILEMLEISPVHYCRSGFLRQSVESSHGQAGICSWSHGSLNNKDMERRQYIQSPRKGQMDSGDDSAHIPLQPLWSVSTSLNHLLLVKIISGHNFNTCVNTMARQPEENIGLRVKYSISREMWRDLFLWSQYKN